MSTEIIPDHILTGGCSGRIQRKRRIAPARRHSGGPPGSHGRGHPQIIRRGTLATLARRPAFFRHRLLTGDRVYMYTIRCEVGAVFSFQCSVFSRENARVPRAACCRRRSDTGGQAAIDTRAIYHLGFNGGGVSIENLCKSPQKSLLSVRHFSARWRRGWGKCKQAVYTRRQMAKFCRQAAKLCREMAELGCQMAKFVRALEDRAAADHRRMCRASNGLRQWLSHRRFLQPRQVQRPYLQTASRVTCKTQVLEFRQSSTKGRENQVLGDRY